MDVKNKTILVTGAASGLGLETARYLSKNGAHVVLCDRDVKVEKIAKEIGGVGYVCDVCSEAEITVILASIDRLHAVINCAGIVAAKRIVGKSGPMPLTDFQKVIDVNLVGTFNVMRLSAAKMSLQTCTDEAKERGVIINTASIAAYEGQLGQAAYAASKGGVASMTLPAARELSQFGIRVMCIAPGIMQTPMMLSLSQDVQNSLRSQIPFPKELGDPLSFAKTVVHIIENSYLNGSTIRLDGGLRLS